MLQIWQVRKNDYSPILLARADILAQKASRQKVNPFQSENKIFLATLECEIRCSGLAEVFSDHFHTYIGRGPFLSVEPDCSHPFKIGQVLA